MTATPSPAALPRPVLADLVPGILARSAVLVVGAALLTAASAQFVIPVPFSPVPVSGQTFAVLLTAAVLGPLRAIAAQSLLAPRRDRAAVLRGRRVGLAPLRWRHGRVPRRLLAGRRAGRDLARRGVDCTPHGTALAFVADSAVIYAVGVPWLALATGADLGQAVEWGLTPFLVGDALKALLAAGLLPLAWKLTGEKPGRRRAH